VFFFFFFLVEELVSIPADMGTTARKRAKRGEGLLNTYERRLSTESQYSFEPRGGLL